MTKADFFLLLDKYLSAQASPEEEQQLLNFYESFHEEGVWDENTMGSQPELENRMRTRLLTAARAEPPARARVRPLWSKLAVAVSILACLATGAWLLLKSAKPASPLPAVAKTQDIAPGGNKAVLTLANGATITLDSAHNGTLAQQGNATVVKQNNGQLAYNIANEKPTEVLYNTLATPRGGQYQLVLPDGSKVWLNAASSIRYPTAFTGKQRGVEITGEAYFEVAKNEKMPFVVKMVSASGDKGEVKVLGTHFNVNAYDDEGTVRTTLLEGSVLVNRGAATAILKPGQQAQVRNAAIKVVDDADIEQVMAWKNGLFNFKKADIQMVMRQITRWYDVDVVYENMPKGTFSGGVSRNTNLSNVLKILALNDVQFRIEGKKIIIKQ